jgi:5-methylcytosine-specific restriction protein A
MPKKAPAPWRPWTSKPVDYKNAQGQGRIHVTGFYKTAAWRKIRAIHISQNPLCVMCQEEGRVVIGNVVDHIKPLNQKDPFNTLNGKFGEPLDLLNLQTLCNKHHNSKSAKERHGKTT